MNVLVTVVVVSYNSASYVVDTLNSILKQTWKEIELIITDDCSKDNTVELCKIWVHKNQERFVHTEILQAKENKGVPANANRGLYASKGEWVSLTAADDTLQPSCIEDNISWIAEHSEARVVFSQMDVYANTFKRQNHIKTTPLDPYNPNSIMAPDRSAQSQYNMLLMHDRIHYTPTLFIHRETLLSVGGFDERFRLLEDHPLWLNLTKNGHRLYFMNKPTVNYRQHTSALNNTGVSYIVNPNYFKEEHFRSLYTYPNLPADVRLNQRYTWYVLQLFRLKWMNRKKKVNQLLFNLLTIYLNPFKYFIWLKKQIRKDLKGNEFYL